jgi:hypothetical protein
LEPKRRWQEKEHFVVDSDGEVTSFIANIPPPIPKAYVGDYVQKLQTATRAVAIDRTVTPTALRVLFYLESVLDYDSALPVSQKHIADELNYYPSDVNKAFKLLIAKGILVRIENPAFKPVYKLNANYGYKGHTMKWQEARKAADPLNLAERKKAAGITTVLDGDCDLA